MSQGLRQASVRAVSGTTLTYEGDWHAMWDLQGIAAGTFNERMIRYANTKLSATYTNVNDAMQALAIAGGATNFGSLGTYSFALGPVPVNSVAPTLSPTSGAIGTLVTCGQGTWSNTPTSYAYQWMRAGVDIGGSTSSTYTTVLADDGVALTCKVRASNANGPAAGYTTTSNSHTVASFTGVLDSYTVGAAYSVRQLRSAYAGNCVRIRRSSDNAEQNFGFVSNVLDTAGIASFVGGGSGFIVTWYDQSGNSLDVTQATAANQPAFIASGINSKPTARLDGTDYLVKVSILPSALLGLSQGTVFGAIKQTGSSGNNVLFVWSLDASNLHSGYITFGDVLYYDFGNDTNGVGRIDVAQPVGWDDNPHVLECLRTSGNSQQIIVDGASLVSASRSATPTDSAGTFILGATSSFTIPFIGDVSEFFTLKVEPGSTARGTIRANMGAYYGITVA